MTHTAWWQRPSARAIESAAAHVAAIFVGGLFARVTRANER
jgi:hypothetical protein